MSNIPIFSYKQYLDDMIRLKDHGHVAVDIQMARPTSAGSRGLARSQSFMKDPVHMMGENKTTSQTNTNDIKHKKITKNEAITAVLEAVTYCKTSGELILPEAIQGNIRDWFESRWRRVIG